MTASAPELLSFLTSYEGQQFPRLNTLQIRLRGSPVLGKDASNFYRALRRVLTKRAENGDLPLKRLDISSALVIDDKGRLAGKVTELRYDQFDDAKSS